MIADSIYAARDPESQGEHYLRHVDRMTVEQFHSKSAIASELAHRDIEIDRLKALNAELAAVLETIVRDADGRRISGNLILDENSPVIIAARAVLAEQKGETE